MEANQSVAGVLDTLDILKQAHKSKLRTLHDRMQYEESGLCVELWSPGTPAAADLLWGFVTELARQAALAHGLDSKAFEDACWETGDAELTTRYCEMPWPDRSRS